jgi:hypothetical protein
MSFIAAFIGLAMSTFFGAQPECKHGAHMHLIWQNPTCSYAPGYHGLGGRGWIPPPG